ncbi:hypothetical protein [Vibrio sp. St2]|uniref:hypothetical protein n=1 Tax=Vibrio sp. St2 TaxID=2853441 RepID=UPI00248E72F4|nr:hypothetical protein [Vibrio sp. St2]
MYYSRGTQNASSIVGRIDHFAFVLFNYLSRHLDIFSVCLLFVGFVTSAFFTYKIPPIRIVAVLFVASVVFVSIVNNIKKKRLDFLFQSILIVFVVFQLSLDQVRTYQSEIAPFIAMIIALSFYKYNDVIYKVLRIVLVVNFLVMTYELATHDYLIKVVAENKYEHGRLQGLFSYSKECGFFLFFAFLYVRKYQSGLFIKSIVIASSLMSGSRTVILFVGFIILLDFFLALRVKFKTKDFYKAITIMLFGGVLFGYLAVKYFDKNNIYMLYRILASFDFSSSSHVDRVFFWSSYIHELDNYTLTQWLFGAGTYLNVLLGNGSENTYLMIISQSGLTGFFIFGFPLVLTLALFFRYPREIYPLVLVLLFLNVGRIGVGWADGILMWCYVISVIYSRSTMDPQGNKLSG